MMIIMIISITIKMTSNNTLAMEMTKPRSLGMPVMMRMKMMKLTNRKVQIIMMAKVFQ